MLPESITNAALLGSAAWIGSALSVGLLASGHCVSMCGGIALSIGQTDLQRSGSGQRWYHSLVPHLWRISLYALLGFSIYWLFHGFIFTGERRQSEALIILQELAIPRWLPALVLIASVFTVRKLFFKGARQCCQKNCIQGKRKNTKDPVPDTFTGHHADVSRQAFNHKAIAKRIPATNIDKVRITKPNRILTILKWSWGLLPCPMVLSMLVLSANASNAIMAGLFMFAFGLGSLPGLLGITIFSQKISVLVEKIYDTQGSFFLNHALLNRSLSNRPLLKHTKSWLVPTVICLGSLWTLTHGFSQNIFSNPDQHHQHLMNSAVTNDSTQTLCRPKPQ